MESYDLHKLRCVYGNFQKFSLQSSLPNAISIAVKYSKLLKFLMRNVRQFVCVAKAEAEDRGANLIWVWMSWYILFRELIYFDVTKIVAKCNAMRCQLVPRQSWLHVLGLHNLMFCCSSALASASYTDASFLAILQRVGALYIWYVAISKFMLRSSFHFKMYSRNLVFHTSMQVFWQLWW